MYIYCNIKFNLWIVLRSQIDGNSSQKNALTFLSGLKFYVYFVLFNSFDKFNLRKLCIRLPPFEKNYIFFSQFKIDANLVIINFLLSVRNTLGNVEQIV